MKWGDEGKCYHPLRKMSHSKDLTGNHVISKDDGVAINAIDPVSNPARPVMFIWEIFRRTENSEIFDESPRCRYLILRA